MVSETLEKKSALEEKSDGFRIDWLNIIFTLIVIALLAFTLIPIIYMATTSLKLPIEIRRSGALLPEEGINFINWIRAYQNVPVHLYLFNSTVVAVFSALMAVVIALPISYVIARFDFGGTFLPAWILGTYVTPPIVISIPVFMMFRTVGMIDSKVGLTLIHAAASLPVAVWLLEGFVRKIPVELDEAAWLDGAGRIGTLWRIIAPVTAPGLVAVYIICMILSWNEFLFALILTYSLDSQTFPIGISSFIGEHGQQFGEMSAAALGGLVPIYLLAFFFQRFLIQGLSTGAVK